MKANVRRLDSNTVWTGSDEVDLVAAGYEAICPKCDELCELIEVPRDDEVVECPSCHIEFKCSTPEHAFA